MQFVPWNVINSWRCNTCGICCRHYDVVLKFPEWLSVVKTYGVEYTKSILSNFSLGRRADGSCMFLYKVPSASICGLQYAKPQACRLWPFKVLDRPRYGRPNDAVYYYRDRRLFVYVDSTCTGLSYGVPTQDFAYSVIPEFIEIAFGARLRQSKSTGFL